VGASNIEKVDLQLFHESLNRSTANPAFFVEAWLSQ